MENVIAFNNELSGLYDTKPPISKAKMAAITKAAMRAIKFYKHVVQSVEKFILKCKPEYKVPGLYVIDSIVRQSRHQFGPEKDVFAPRFARNIKETFANLFRCVAEDKSRIIRVLNLWQKNKVFATEIIQPIFDLADPNHPIYSIPTQQTCNLSGGAGTNNISGSLIGGSNAGVIANISGSSATSSGTVVSLGNTVLNDVQVVSNSANGLNSNTTILVGNSSIGHNVTTLDMMAMSGGGNAGGGGSMQSSHASQISSHLNEDKLQNTSLGDLSSSIVTQSDNNYKSLSRNNLNTNIRTLEIPSNLKYATKQRCPSTNSSNDNNNNNSCSNTNMSINAAAPPPPPPPLPMQATQSVPVTKLRDHNKYGMEITTSSGSTSGGGGVGNVRSGVGLTAKVYHSECYNKYQRSAGSMGHQLHHDYEYEENTNMVTAIHHRDSDNHNNDDNTHHHENNDLDDYGDSSIEYQSPKNASSNSTTNNLLDNNNLKQLLNDPNVLRQLQTLQNFQKFKQDDKQHNNNLRLQEEAFEKHLQNALKANVVHSINPDPNEYSKEVEFVSEEQNIEVINLDGNDSRSPTPERERYKRRRSRSRSRSRERDRGGNRRSRRSRTRSRSRSRSPPSLSSRGSRRGRNSRERERERSNRDKERDREHERERRKRGLPDIRKEHLSVCSTTLWVGHLSKLVYQEELSDTFGEFGDIVSIDQIVPRGCAFIVMNRRQDAYKAMQTLRNRKLQGRAITISWAAGKGVKSKEWKDFWDLELGATYIPWHKLDDSTDLDSLEEGGMFDEDSMPSWMKELINKKKNTKEKAIETSKVTPVTVTVPMIVQAGPPPTTNQPMMFGIDTSQPPPNPPGPGNHPPPLISIVPGQFPMTTPPMGGPPTRILGPPLGMPIAGIHMPPNIVQPHAAMMMMPGFGCVPGQIGGPNTVPHIGPGSTRIQTIGAVVPNSSHGQPPHFAGPPPPASTGMMNSNINHATLTATTATLNTSDDQMDIEMEDDEASAAHKSIHQTSNTNNSGESVNFSQPPPIFNMCNIPPSIMNADTNTSNTAPVGETDSISGNEVNDIFTRDRRPQSSRWSCRGATGTNLEESRWHEDNTSKSGPSSYQSGRCLLSDFINDSRGGQNFNGGGNDFHSNLSNRFQSPTSLMQMRIPPPSAFNTRGPSGPPSVFMRGQGGPGGRLQSSCFYNRNNPFDRDSKPFGSSRGGGIRGGTNRGRHNWDDEDNDFCAFKRRLGGGSSIVGPNRFRDRGDILINDRHSTRGNGRRGGLSGGASSRDRYDNRDDRDNKTHVSFSNRHSTSENSNKIIQGKTKKFNSIDIDPEPVWDRKLEECGTISKNNCNNKNNVKDVTIANVIDNRSDSKNESKTQGGEEDQIEIDSHQSLPNENTRRHECEETESEVSGDNTPSNGSIKITPLLYSYTKENCERITNDSQKPYNEASSPVKLTDVGTEIEINKNAVTEIKSESSVISIVSPNSNNNSNTQGVKASDSPSSTKDVELINNSETYCVN